MSNLQLNSICNPNLFESSSSQIPQPDITLFGLSNEIENMMEILMKVNTSELFQTFWYAEGKSATGKCATRGLSIDDVLKLVWKPAHMKWKALGKEIKDGSILLETVETIFGKFKNKKNQFKTELQVLCDEGDDMTWLDTRFEQLRQCDTLAQFHQAARYEHLFVVYY